MFAGCVVMIVGASVLVNSSAPISGVVELRVLPSISVVISVIGIPLLLMRQLSGVK